MDRIEAAAKAIAEVVYPVLSWDGLPRDAKDYYMKLARAASAVLSDEPSYKKCGKVAQTFIAREGSFFPCALEEGHQGNCLQSGTCFRHGVYFGKNCPHWPTCAADARTPQEVLSGVGAALSQATPQQTEVLEDHFSRTKHVAGYTPSEAQTDAEVNRLRELCAAVYQFVGANLHKIGGCRRFLDALSNAANGEPFDTEHLLPYDSDEPICMTDGQPAPVQPSGTEDVVERLKLRKPKRPVVYEREGGDVMDRECIPICDALNLLPGIETISSCCGHGYAPFRIYFKAQWLDDLKPILELIDESEFWTLRSSMATGNMEIYFVLDGLQHDSVFIEANKLAEQIAARAQPISESRS